VEFVIKKVAFRGGEGAQQKEEGSGKKERISKTRQLVGRTRLKTGLGGKKVRPKNSDKRRNTLESRIPKH